MKLPFEQAYNWLSHERCSDLSIDAKVGISTCIESLMELEGFDKISTINFLVGVNVQVDDWMGITGKFIITRNKSVIKLTIKSGEGFARDQFELVYAMMKYRMSYTQATRTEAEFMKIPITMHLSKPDVKLFVINCFNHLDSLMTPDSPF